MFSRQGLWQTADNPSGANDPGWGHSFPFVTFENLVEVAGVTDDADFMK